MSEFDELDIDVRAYTEEPDKPPVAAKSHNSEFDEPSDWAIIFDCETLIDPSQSLRFGFYQVRKSGELMREGVFYNAETLGPSEIEIIEQYARDKGILAISDWDFRREFLKVGYNLRGSIIGFNLPFDISRIAIDHGYARKSMRGGFSFRFSKDRRTPSVRVKHLSRNAALIDFAVPGMQETPRGERRKGFRVAKHRGFFIDVKTLAAALTPNKGSLASLCEFLETQTRKHESDEHGALITLDYLDYSRRDVQATWECYEELSRRYSEHALDSLEHRILSEASVGKGYLSQMRVSPLLAKQTDFPRERFGKAMCAYYGGRAEVRIRRQIRQVLYTDFKSMYPTVNALMGLWKYVIADQITTRDVTAEIRDLLDRITIDDLQSKELWPKLTVLVCVRPESDLFPVRAKYDGRCNTIGLNYLTANAPLYYTLADCIAAKMLTGKMPKIEEAIAFDAGKPQRGLQPINLFGKPEFKIDPLRDDFFARTVDLRDDAKAKRESAEKAIKIIANATSYGIFIEINRDDAPKPEPLDVFGTNGERQAIHSTALEQPGKFFNPMLGVFITGAARLMLALAEKKTLDAELEWVFCDTDSLAIAKPEGMPERDFMDRAQSVIDWFKPFNPYRKTGSILQKEEANYAVGEPKILEPLYAYAISAKRYALFNIGKSGGPVIRKASAHGLGHLIAPYSEDEAPPEIPKPSIPVYEIGVSRWQYDLWFSTVMAALAGEPDLAPLDYHPAFDQPALSRYGATSPRMLDWFKSWNDGKSYAVQVKPFGFMTAFQARNGSWADFDAESVEGPQGRGRPKAKPEFAPVAPFNKEPEKALAEAFDRNTGESVPEELLKTYREALCQYHLASEAKFRNGSFHDKGETFRRRVKAKRIGLIGKEGNNIERDGLDIPDATIQLYSLGIMDI